MSSHAPRVAQRATRQATRPCASAAGLEVALPAGARQLIRRLNATTRFRFTTLYRLERSRLVGIWVHDRENPRVNARPPVDAPACCYRAAGIEVPPSGLAEARSVATERWHDALAVRLGDGRLLGVVCHSDARPRLVDALASVEGESMVMAVAKWLASVPPETWAKGRHTMTPDS